MIAGRRRGVLWPPAIVLLTVVAYGPAYRAGFIWDDDAHVTAPALRSWHGLVAIWTRLGATQQYYPLLHSAFWVEHRLWGDAAAGYHVANVLIHALVALMAGVCGRQLRLRGAWWIAAAFAVHPVNVESVAWISEQKNTLSALAYLGAAWGFLRWRDGGSRWNYVLATAAFLAALLCKSVTATLPGGLLVALWWREGRLSWRREVAPLLPWIGLGLAAGVFTTWVERHYVGAGGTDFALSAAQRLCIAGRNLWFYAAKLLWPAGLSFIYPRWDVPAGLSWRDWIYPCAALALLALAAIRRWRGTLAAALFFAGTLLPALGFVNVYPFVFSFVADHFQYLASLGVLVAFGLTADVAPAAAAGVLLIWSAVTWHQAAKYETMKSLYAQTLQENPDAWLAHDNLGVILAREGRVDEAIAHYRAAIRLKPGYPEAYNNLGNALARAGQLHEAISQYALALRARPGFAAAEFDWGNALADAGDPGAAAHFLRALQLQPVYPEAECKLGNLLANAGRVGEAIARYQRALAERPGYAEPEANLALALALQGRTADAVNYGEQAVRDDPHEAAYHAYLGFAYAKAGRTADAIREYQVSLRLHPNNPDAEYQLRQLQAGRGALP